MTPTPDPTKRMIDKWFKNFPDHASKLSEHMSNCEFTVYLTSEVMVPCRTFVVSPGKLELQNAILLFGDTYYVYDQVTFVGPVNVLIVPIDKVTKLQSQPK